MNEMGLPPYPYKRTAWAAGLYPGRSLAPMSVAITRTHGTDLPAGKGSLTAVSHSPGRGQVKIGGLIGYRLLRWLQSGDQSPPTQETASSISYIPKLERILGSEGWEGLRGKTILDFGCGMGQGSIEIAQLGADRVIGLDIRPEMLEYARQAASAAGVSHICEFHEAFDEPVDLIVSIDSFEHFDDPAQVLAAMGRLLKDNGRVLLSFGPTWYHPYGGHLFSIFPWSHLLFTEEAQIRWRADFKDDGATRFSEVSGGLNMMTIGRFEQLIEHSPFRLAGYRLVPIRPLAWAHNRLTREFTTSIVECQLLRRLESITAAFTLPGTPMKEFSSAVG